VNTGLLYENFMDTIHLFLRATKTPGKFSDAKVLLEHIPGHNGSLRDRANLMISGGAEAV
jgi:hypothetical protein